MKPAYILGFQSVARTTCNTDASARPPQRVSLHLYPRGNGNAFQHCFLTPPLLPREGTGHIWLCLMRIARPGGNEVDRMAVPDGGRRPRPSPASTARPLRFLFTRFAPWTPSPAARAPRRPAPRRRHAGPSERRLRDGNRPQAIFPASGHYRQTYSMIRIPPRPPCIPRPPSFPAIARRGYSPIGRRTSPPGSPGARETKFSCTLVAHMWHFAYLCRRNTTSLGKRAIALLPHSIPSHFPHPTEHGSRPGTADTPPRVPARAHLRQQAGTGVPPRRQRPAGEGAKVRPQAVTREGGREGRL